MPDSGSTEDMPAPVRITYSDEREDGAPSVSPDGRWAAFESHRAEDEDSPTDLWIISVPPVLGTTARSP